MAKKLSPAALSAHISRLIELWPKDNVRPDSVSMQRYLQSRLNPPTTAETASKYSEVNKVSPKGLSEKNIRALYTLLENRYAKAHPFPEKLRYPKSMPTHYDDLIREFQEAPHRSLWGRIQKRLSGMFRLK